MYLYLQSMKLAGQSFSISPHAPWDPPQSLGCPNLFFLILNHGEKYIAHCNPHLVFYRSYTKLKHIFYKVIPIFLRQLYLSYVFFFNVYLFLRETETERDIEHKWGRGRERGRHRIGSRLQALSCQHRARRGARTHGP